MKKKETILILSFLFMLVSCGQAPSTEELDKDIAELTKEVKLTENESNKYSGGFLKTLIDIKKEILTNTRLMLEQKRNGIKRFIHINYNIDGQKYLPPDNKDELISKLQNEINTVQDDITKVKKESSRYSGGLLKGLLEVKAATMENSLAFIKQRELLLKYDIPFYSIIPKSASGGKGQGFKATPGEDIEKF